MKRTIPKSFLTLLLVFSMIFTFLALTGCGKKDEDEDEGNKGPSVNAEEGRQEFIDSIGGTSDTYTGSVSEEAYESKDEAALAYVNKEIIGLYKEATLESVTSKGELSDSEIEALKLPEEIKGDVDSVEKLEVTYSELEGYSALSASSSSTKTAIVYIVKIGPDYRYFTPCPVKGDTITKSYYDSVFNDEKYANCTYINESYAKVTQTVAGQTVTYEATMVQEIKRDNGKVFFKQTITGDYELVVELGGDAYLECYMEKDDEGNVQTWVRSSASGSWSRGSLTQNIDPFAGQNNLDYTYFSKADFGFALKGENAIKFYKGHTNSQIPEDAKLALYAEYYVKEGVLSGMRMEYSCDMTVTQYGYEVHSITNGLNKMSCVNYGTTVVERPAVD